MIDTSMAITQQAETVAAPSGGRNTHSQLRDGRLGVAGFVVAIRA
jgi:hypothetical protein